MSSPQSHPIEDKTTDAVVENTDAPVAALLGENYNIAMPTETERVVPEHRQQELPFLVTHWLENYGRNTVDFTMNTSSDCPNDERQEAVARIRRATSEIASAFATLGAYGTTFQVSSLLSVACFRCLF